MKVNRVEVKLMEAKKISNQTTSTIAGEPAHENTGLEVAKAERFALLNICPHCWNWNITTVKETIISNNVMNGSKVSPLKNWGCKSCGKVYHMNSQHNHWVWAAVHAKHLAQVRDLRQVAEYCNMQMSIAQADNPSRTRSSLWRPETAERAWNTVRGYDARWHGTPQPFARAQRLGLRGGR
jgi:hypothetical protein